MRMKYSKDIRYNLVFSRCKSLKWKIVIRLNALITKISKRTLITYVSRIGIANANNTIIHISKISVIH